MLVSCPECSKEFSDVAKVCPHCGYRKARSWLWLKLLIGVPLIIFVIAAFMAKDDDSYNARAAIKVCWNDQAKKSNDPSMARFIASVCEKMERDFRGKYGVSP
jgi:hypothetical protein